MMRGKPTSGGRGRIMRVYMKGKISLFWKSDYDRVARVGGV